MERLSVASSQAVGHDLTIFSYEPERLRREGLDARIQDAREVLFDASLGPLQQNKPDHFSDHFRVEGLHKRLGVWLDLDLVFLRPLPDQPYIFGWEGATSINGAVLGLPADSGVLADYLALCRQRPVQQVAPWWPLRKKMSRTLKVISKRLRGRPITPMHYGPEAVTHFISANNLADRAAQMDVYYPAPPPPLGAHFVEPGGVEAYLTPETRTVHLWHSLYRRRFGDAPPPPETWLGKKCREFGVQL
jgi:hypothetical protein